VVAVVAVPVLVSVPVLVPVVAVLPPGCRCGWGCGPRPLVVPVGMT
jgi:hypothetical protein